MAVANIFDSAVAAVVVVVVVVAIIIQPIGC